MTKCVSLNQMTNEAVKISAPLSNHRSTYVRTTASYMYVHSVQHACIAASLPLATTKATDTFSPATPLPKTDLLPLK
jgi:hypothetical protein